MAQTNHYLIDIGDNVAFIRDCLNWSQTELAKKTGLSRATIANIETKPGHMNRTWALVIFSVVFTELSRRKQLLTTAPSAVGQNTYAFLRDLGLTNKTWKILLGPAFLLGSGILPLIANAALALVAKKLAHAEEEKLISAASQAIYELERKLLTAFSLSELTMETFMKQLDESED